MRHRAIGEHARLPKSVERVYVVDVPVQHRVGCFRGCGRAWRIACNEISVMLTCSRRTAEVHIEIGDALREFLPATLAAFTAGELDYARVRKIVDGLTGATLEAIAALERSILASAHRLPPGQLERDIDRQLIAFDPGAAAVRREKMLAHRDVRTRADRHGLAQLQATLSAHEAVEAAALITEVANSVCNHDPRDASTRRADALVALVHGEQRLSCQCGRPECSVAGSAIPTRRKPLLHIVCDLAMLLAMSSDPATVAGYGPIDSEYLRELAWDASWQVIFADLHAQVAASRTQKPVPPRRFHRPARLRSAGERIRRTQQNVKDDPGINERPDGHGGFEDPPPGALVYTPGAALAAYVRAVDGHCRYPGCSVPAQRCQLDHVVEFDHDDPVRGGWTVEANLQAVCSHHHQLKTYRLWTPVLLDGRAVHWTDNTRGLTAVTVPGGHSAPPPDSVEVANPPSGKTRTAWIKHTEDADALFEETWWERHMRPGDRAASERAFGTVEDPVLRHYCREMLGHYRAHQAIIASRRFTTPKWGSPG
ncbi:HNH endonuclease signature motif containing protein [Rhodococcus sp. ARC_M6]|uniref:HNH endonuclease signature motif containing protein n=1 Tax=Rhodococcus sp. ARC_M6 TaxID=2928852 RepID=UPI001FB2155D|nr:HNH endonuclease signature motif containing protein [Rhodococcus sp. ARC_M6]MCJ0906924.1 HNH endonuclease [Rhodococcus sp. ARC_M6]